MEGIFLGTSLAAAFVAGMVALFAPCCVTVMFPAYLAAAVRNSRWRLVPLTLVFAAGVALVLVPVTLGLSLLAESLLRFHSWVYGAGAVLMAVLAVLTATGRTWSLPLMRGAPDVARTDSGGVFALGVFSGAASSCCAPVLAGVLALSTVAPGPLVGTGIGLAYVFGMVFPMFVATLVWDRSKPGTVGRLRSRDVRWGIGRRRFRTTTLSLASAAMFLVMAVVLAAVAATGTTLAPAFLQDAAGAVRRLLAPVAPLLEATPDWLAGLILVAFAVLAVAWSGRRRSRDEADSEAPGPARSETR